MYDLTDITRQVISNLFVDLYQQVNYAYNLSQQGQDTSDQIRSVGTVMLQAISDMDKILATNVNFLLGNWIEVTDFFSVFSQQ